MKAADKLRVWWFKRDRCLGGDYPVGRQTKTDLGWLFAHVFTEDMEAEMKRRGYDPRTIRFSIEPMAGNERFASQRPDAGAESTDTGPRESGQTEER